MLPEDKILLEEENPVSLQKALVIDDGYFLSLVLCPPQESSIPIAAANHRYVSVVLCRGKRAFWTVGLLLPLGSHQKQLLKAAESLPFRWPPTRTIGYLCCRIGLLRDEKYVRSMVFVHPPAFKLLWAIPEKHIALLLNGEPWAIINDRSGISYSKGLLRSKWASNIWDQQLYEQVFCKR